MESRPLLRAAQWGFGGTLVAAVVAVAAGDSVWQAPAWQAHGLLAAWGFLVPAFLWLVDEGVNNTTGRHVRGREMATAAFLLAAGAWIMAASAMLLLGNGRPVALGVGGIMVVAGVVVQASGLLPQARAGASRAADPLTKGDDASLQAIRLGHFFMAAGATASLAAAALRDVPGVNLVWAPAAMHVAFAGGVLLTVYGVGHLWIPRFTQVPAIAAGAIKGEIHSTMLAVVFLSAGMALDVSALTLAGGGLLFVGSFTFMGVLGANVMKQKARLQRITREFVYVPWTFAGIFWLLSGVLLGMLSATRPAALAEQTEALRFTHIHVALYGGFALLALGWTYPILARAAKRENPTYGRTKAAFWLLNSALAVLIVGAFQGFTGWGWLSGAALAFLGAAAWFISLRALRPAWPQA